MKPISICIVDKLTTKGSDYMSRHICDEEKFDACCLQIAVTGYFAILARPLNTKHIRDACKVTAECVHCTGETGHFYYQKQHQTPKRIWT